MFLDCSYVLPPAARALYSGVTVADLDGDGRFEFFVAASCGPNRVLKCVGGTLRDVAPPLLADARRNTLSATAGDFDGDGREELYLLNDDPATDRLLDRQLDGRWVDLFARHERTAVRGRMNQTAAAIDRRGNGRYSFLVAGEASPLRLYELGPANAICDLAPVLDLSPSLSSRGVVVAPVASERSDIFCVNDTGPNLLFRNTGVGTFLEVAAEHGLHGSAERNHATVVLDAAGDGRLGVCLGNREGPHRLLVRQADGRFRNAATPAMALPSDVQNVVAADFDNDGREELLFLNAGEANRLFRRDGSDWQMADAGAVEGWDVASVGAAVADIDNDGRLELLVSNGDAPGQPLQLFKWPDAGNGWLRVQPLTRFGATARGAVVRLTTARGRQIRAICSGSGYRCQMEPVAHFGLGTDDRVQEVTVTWPDETTETIERPAVNRTLVVEYPGF